MTYGEINVADPSRIELFTNGNCKSWIGIDSGKWQEKTWTKIRLLKGYSKCDVETVKNDFGRANRV